MPFDTKAFRRAAETNPNSPIGQVIKEQKQEFREFMVKKSGLKEKVGLPQLFLGISRWIDHTK